MNSPRQAAQTEPRIAPAPWRLTGHGFVTVIRCSRVFGAACARDDPALAGRALGGIGALMVVDYASSNVGPYRELLLTPGLFAFGSRRARVITHIWVSTATSVDNGRRNWGIPKRQASFGHEHGTTGTDRFVIARGGRSPLTLGFRAYRPRLPVTTRIVPPCWRSIAQPWRGVLLNTAIRASGRLACATLSEYDNPADSGFPDIRGQKRLAALAIPRFNLVFPKPHTSALPGNRP